MRTNCNSVIRELIPLKGDDMFELTIERIEHLDVTTHPTRELAHAELLRATHGGEQASAVEAGWSRSRYQIRDGSDAITGRAFIVEVCDCGHPESDHDGGGCTAVATDDSDCRCARHTTDEGHAALFDTTAFSPVPTGAVTP
jgi:hypothetical protein